MRKPTEIIAGIYQIRVPNPSGSRIELNSYLIKGADGWMMVDTGWATESAFQSLEAGLTDLGITFQDINYILVTHLHPDHFGLAGKVRQMSGAKLAVHESEMTLARSATGKGTNFIKQMDLWLRQNGMPADRSAEMQRGLPRTRRIPNSAIPDVVLEDGDRISNGIFNFEVIWTPGHSAGHICLHETNNNILISGDHILPKITPNIGLSPWSGENPLGNYLSSLEKLEALDVDMILPAHEWAFSDSRGRIQELRQHHEERKLNVLKALGTKAETGYHVALGIPWIINNKETAYENLSPMDKRMATWETLAHLDLLQREGKVEIFSKEDVTYHRACGK